MKTAGVKIATGRANVGTVSGRKSVRISTDKNCDERRFFRSSPDGFSVEHRQSFRRSTGDLSAFTTVFPSKFNPELSGKSGRERRV